MTGIEPVTSSLPRTRSTPELHRLNFWSNQSIFFKYYTAQNETVSYRAGDETRTRDPQLGRLMLYQLSYSRLYYLIIVGREGFEPSKLAQQIYSLPHLATLESPLQNIKKEPIEGFEPPTR